MLHITVVWGERSHGPVDVHSRFHIICCLHRREAVVPLKRCYVFTRLRRCNFVDCTVRSHRFENVKSRRYLKIGTVNWVELGENRNLGLRFYPFSVLRGFNIESEVLAAFAICMGRNSNHV